MAIVSYTQEELDQIRRERAAEFDAELKALAEMPDEEIDFSDIPRLTEEDFKRAMNVQEFEAYRAAKRKQAATV